MAKNVRPPASLDEWLDWMERLASQKASGLSVSAFLRLAGHLKFNYCLRGALPGGLFC